MLLEGLGMIFVKAGKIATYGHANPWTDFFTMNVAKILPASVALVSVFAFVKLMSGMIWLLVVGRNITWGVAWHRFSAFPNIYFKREDDGGVALGAAEADDVRAASRSTWRTPTPTRTPSAPAGSRTSAGRAGSTSPPAPSAAAASRSARPGTPASRCRRSC